MHRHDSAGLFCTVVLFIIMLVLLASVNTLKKENESLVRDNHDLTLQVQQQKTEIRKLEKQVRTASTAVGGCQLSYEHYQCISDTNSPNYRLTNLQATTDSNGLRKVGDRYCVALGSYFDNDVGEKYIMTMSTGVKIPLIVGDQKADADTWDTRTGKDGSVIEFIVDEPYLKQEAKVQGSVSWIPGFGGTIAKIEKG